MHFVFVKYIVCPKYVCFYPLRFMLEKKMYLCFNTVILDQLFNTVIPISKPVYFSIFSFLRKFLQ